MRLPRALWIALTVLITLAWTVNVAVGFVWPDRIQPGVNLVFGAVVGSLYLPAVKPTARRVRQRMGRAIAGEQNQDDEPATGNEDA
ncbi:hypothetical protein [Actinosynnema mirum]|uniref:Uncharacterized protein n=1 Tax=Actinosynnema mirum (strain ATCC 29888 / DSM 43827 / JCM 3225 / NBRC 14064 / NCIMB 13271 / NRRL B-12336 / IMRU 3971 / 101) TaxID=446462 RepID=C6WC69_ACTMD|nr:hypothetical protein [Actinosynnema mirum]ACU39457.1 hypothetical protein Amir_5641 [Actinosynnema mirum DSM 43827]